MDNRWTAVKCKCASVKLGGNLGVMVSTKVLTKPEPVNNNTRQLSNSYANLVKTLSDLAVLVGS